MKPTLLLLMAIMWAVAMVGWAIVCYFDYRKANPKLKQFFMTFTGSVPVMLMAHRYEDDGTWQRYFDDRGIELMRIPSSWKRTEEPTK